jgi:hypothetical protein
MTTREVVRRLRSFEAGQPTARYSTLHQVVSRNAFLVSFLRMAGETRPWGVIYGRPDSEPKFLSVPDGRNRNAIDEMVEEFARDILTHFRVVGFFDSVEVESPDLDLEQLWIPNSSHLDMFAYLNYAYWRRPKDAEHDSASNVFSRFAGWLVRESNHQGQQKLVDASSLMKESFVFPVDDMSSISLEAQEAWFKQGNYKKRLLAARAAGDRSLGITMDVDVELELQNHIQDVSESRKRQTANLGAENHIKTILFEQAIYRWEALKKAYERLSNDERPVNRGLFELVADTQSRFENEVQRQERQQSDPEQGPAFIPHPETDFHGSAAAASYYMRRASESKFLPVMIHEDREMLAEAIASGHALRARVFKVFEEKKGNFSDIFWVVRSLATDEFRINSGETLSPLGNRSHTVKTRNVKFINSNEIEIILQWMNRKTTHLDTGLRQRPNYVAWESQEMVFVPSDQSIFDEKAAGRVWKSREGIGSWLTHSKAIASPDPKIIDDATQIEGK